MDFSTALCRGERVVWSAQIEKEKHDATIRPAPVIAEDKQPRMCHEKHGALSESNKVSNAGEFRVTDQRVIKALRRKWGIGL